jgi:hypothetical protein
MAHRLVQIFKGTGALLLAMCFLAPPLAAQESLQQSLLGSWRLVSYTYESNGRVYTSPDAMEGVANFSPDGYDIDILAYIPSGSSKRARRAFESGSFSIQGDDLRLMADHASHAAELGEETLTGVTIDGDEMRLTSNNGAIHELWERFPQ